MKNQININNINNIKYEDMILKNFDNKNIILEGNLDKFKKHFKKLKTKNRKYRGVKIRIGGRIGGTSKSRFRKFIRGSLGTSTVIQPIYYISKPLHTKWGILGFKVWKSL
jgi:ribosomal protein S3